MMTPSQAVSAAKYYDAVCNGVYDEESSPLNGLDYYDSCEYDPQESSIVEEFLDDLTDEIIFEDFVREGNPSGYYEYLIRELKQLSA